MQGNHSFSVSGLVFSGAFALLLAGCSNPREEGSASPVKTSIGTQIDDTLITTRVKSAFLSDPEIKSFDLKVETRKGAVQLSGFVNSPAQIERAIKAAGGVEGVQSVENGILLKSGAATVGNTVDDGIITTKVKSALLADPNVKSFDIAVVTRKGEVQLSGYVDSQSQIDQANAIGHNVEGVTGVVSNMSIKK
jgi:hyperosmotically inducible protein